MGDVEAIMESSFPIVTVLMSITGSKTATTILVVGLMLIGFCVCIATIASTSRLTWAWARDGGLPKWFAYVDPKHCIPVRAIWLPVALVCILSLLNIASTAAFSAIMALSSLGLFISYFLAIASILSARFGKTPLRLGVWNMGRWGAAVNIFSLIYTLWIIIFLPIPQFLPVTPTSMNYAGPILGLVLVMAMVVWFARANKHWAGPNLAIVKIIMESE